MWKPKYFVSWLQENYEEDSHGQISLLDLYQKFRSGGGESSKIIIGKYVQFLFQSVRAAKAWNSSLKREFTVYYGLRERTLVSEMTYDDVTFITQWVPSPYFFCNIEENCIQCATFGELLLNGNKTTKKITFYQNKQWELHIGETKVDLNSFYIENTFDITKYSIQNVCSIVSKLKTCLGKPIENHHLENEKYVLEYVGEEKLRIYRSLYCKGVLFPNSHIGICPNCRGYIKKCDLNNSINSEVKPKETKRQKRETAMLTCDDKINKNATRSVKEREKCIKLDKRSKKDTRKILRGGNKSKASRYSKKSLSEQRDERKPNCTSNTTQNMEEGTPKTAIIIGAGSRGHGYPFYALIHPNKLKVVGVCEPRDFHRKHEVEQHKIPPENVFKDWKEAAERDRFADSVIICTPDRLHKEPAIAFAKKGYHILLEKPMAVTEADCREIVSTCKENNTILVVCHVLRYTPWVKKVKEIIDSGVIGDVVNINHTEPVGFWHFAHSYVRGNWHKEADSSFSLLAKCCHDVDLISHWMRGKPCQRVSSFGNLSHFHKEDKVGFWHFAHSFVRGNWHKEASSSFSLLAKCCHDVDLVCYWMSKKCEKVSSFGNLSHFHKADKPAGAADRCLDCPADIENNCPYSAKKIYLERVKYGNTSWPSSVLCDIVDIENVTDALRKGPYGKCVYDTDNDVMSHQVVNMQFEGGATATLQMVAFTKKLCAREVKIHGTKGEITVADGELPPIKVFNFLTGKTLSYDPEEECAPGPLSGHGGADYHTIKAFVDALHNPTADLIETGLDDTLSSHLLCFAAERARKENRVLNRNSQWEFE